MSVDESETTSLIGTWIMQVSGEVYPLLMEKLRLSQVKFTVKCFWGLQNLQWIGLIFAGSSESITILKFKTNLKCNPALMKMTDCFLGVIFLLQVFFHYELHTRKMGFFWWIKRYLHKKSNSSVSHGKRKTKDATTHNSIAQIKYWHSKGSSTRMLRKDG